MGFRYLYFLRLFISDGNLVSLVVTKSYVCYQVGRAEYNWVQIPLGSNFSDNTEVVSDLT